MADSTTTQDGSAATMAAMWGERARDWAEVMEGPNGWGIPVYERILERVRRDRRAHGGSYRFGVA
jgi:hypothetical protein